jgi:probable phosphoglycerate mutase
MDQDVTHRLSAPSSLAGNTPRYSLVWKLVFLPKQPGAQCSISRPEWGEPDAFGSAAKAQAVVRQLAKTSREAKRVRRDA